MGVLNVAAISRSKEYKALAERIRYGFRNNIGYSRKIQEGLRYLEEVKAGIRLWDADKASGLARISGTVYDRRRKSVNDKTGLTYYQELELESMQNEMIDVYGTSGNREMYSEANTSKDVYKSVSEFVANQRREEAEAFSIIRGGRI